MNESTDIIKKGETAVCQKLKRLASMTAEADYDVTLRISGEDAESGGVCTHHIKGRSKHDLTTLLAIGGLTVAAIAAIVCYLHVFCSLVCGKR